MFADPLGLSQLTASFFAAECQGILRMPFLHSVIPTRSLKNYSSQNPAVNPFEGDIPKQLKSAAWAALRNRNSPPHRLPCFRVVSLGCVRA